MSPPLKELLDNYMGENKEHHTGYTGEMAHRLRKLDELVETWPAPRNWGARWAGLQDRDRKAESRSYRGRCRSRSVGLLG